MSIAIVLAAALLAVAVFFPRNRQQSQLAAAAAGEAIAPQAEVENHFLAQLQADVTASLHPRPTDSILKRHYDALVAAELENRLAAMPQ